MAPQVALASPARPNFEAIDRLKSPWDASSLRALLTSKPSPDQVIVVSNRQPFSHERIDGRLQITRPASGLVTALEPILQACAGTWIAHGSGNADREVVDEQDGWQVSWGSFNYRLQRVWLNAAEQTGHTDGFSNSGLWPLCHSVQVRPSFKEHDWLHYCQVNQHFANAVVSAARQADPIVLVHDYHLGLVPAMVRSRLPHATIVSFWHIPWAHCQRMETCPWLSHLVNGLLGSDIVGFQTQKHCNHFINLIQRMSQHAVCSHSQVMSVGARKVQARHYPVSIAWATAAQEKRLPNAADCRLAAAEKFEVPLGGKLIVGIDRFDYTKGLMERLQAVELLLESCPRWQGRLRFVQVATPTRSALPDYAAFCLQVKAEVLRINARFETDAGCPIVLLDRHHDREEVLALYRAADVCLVSSLDDGMNLVCKEFVAARNDEQGVLVLSCFAGAAAELHEALIVNPYHTSQMARSLDQALSMPLHEQRRRMTLLRATVRERNVYRWAAEMLIDATALRSQSASRGSLSVVHRSTMTRP
jgi:trehalose-6-phosphate synthase